MATRVKPARPKLQRRDVLTDEERAELEPLREAVRRREDAHYGLTKRLALLAGLTADPNPKIAQAARGERRRLTPQLQAAAKAEYDARVEHNRVERRIARARWDRGCEGCP